MRQVPPGEINGLHVRIMDYAGSRLRNIMEVLLSKREKQNCPLSDFALREAVCGHC